MIFNSKTSIYSNVLVFVRNPPKTFSKEELTAASTLAGESPLGSASIEITLIMMVSTVWMGSQRSSGFS